MKKILESLTTRKEIKYFHAIKNVSELCYNMEIIVTWQSVTKIGRAIKSKGTYFASNIRKEQKQHNEKVKKRRHSAPHFLHPRFGNVKPQFTLLHSICFMNRFLTHQKSSNHLKLIFWSINLENTNANLYNVSD